MSGDWCWSLCWEIVNNRVPSRINVDLSLTHPWVHFSHFCDATSVVAHRAVAVDGEAGGEIAQHTHCNGKGWDEMRWDGM